MNKSEQAIQWLEAAAGEGFPCYPLFESDPNLDNIRGDTHFVASMTQLRQQWLNYKTLFCAKRIDGVFSTVPIA